MTDTERIAKIDFLRYCMGKPGYPKTISAAMELASEAMGRPVWTHELAFLDMLIAEIRRGTPADFEEIANKVPAEKRIIVVLADPNKP